MKYPSEFLYISAFPVSFHFFPAKIAKRYTEEKVRLLEKSLREQCDEEGCSAVFAALIYNPPPKVGSWPQ